MATMFEEFKQRISAIIEPYIAELGVELFELNIKQYHQTIMIEILVDKPRGGILVDVCTQINRFLNGVIEEKEIFEAYALEVSSPGVDRPLVTKKDFLRVIGRKVRFHLLEEVNSKKEYWGTVEEVQEDEVLVQVKTERLRIVLKNISKAMQII